MFKNPINLLCKFWNKGIILILLVAFIFSGLPQIPAESQEFNLPAPGVMIHLSPRLDPPILKGIKVHTDDPFRFDFILDQGDNVIARSEATKQSQQEQLKQEATKLIKYFLASLTIPEKDLWVNLSPYEKNRIIPQSFGLTEMGRDLLAEDYLLKQITASLIYPEDETGKKFWKRIYEEAAKRYGTTDIPVNTFNRVWIVPQEAVVFENSNAGTAYVIESKLKVMLEEDYLSLEKHEGGKPEETQAKNTNKLGSQVVREIVIPELTAEVNENKNFYKLRQVYNSLILAAWYKKKIKESILSQVYADKSKVAGVNIDDPQEKEKIYHQYLMAFKKGVYNYIKEEQDPMTQEVIPRKYFSGGMNMAMTSSYFGSKMVLRIIHEESLLPEATPNHHEFIIDARINQAMKRVVSRRKFLKTASLGGAAALPAIPGLERNINKILSLEQGVHNGASGISQKSIESVRSLIIRDATLDQTRKMTRYEDTGIYHIGPIVSGRPAVLFIRGAWEQPEAFDRLITASENEGKANIFVFTYDYKRALENAVDLQKWLGIWFDNFGQNGNIIVAHSFGNNVLVKAVEDMESNNRLIPFLKETSVIQVAPTLDGSKRVKRLRRIWGGRWSHRY